MPSNESLPPPPPSTSKLVKTTQKPSGSGSTMQEQAQAEKGTKKSK